MPSLVDYEPHYRRGERLFGEPSRPIAAFFRAGASSGLPGPRPARVLDLGCGQGRDALVAARAGHAVVGVDLSATGVAQMLADARADGLVVQGVVADLLTFRSRRKFSVVMLDRVLHLLPGPAARRRALDRLAALTRVGGFALVAGSPTERDLVHGHFARHAGIWRLRQQQADFVCAERRARPRGIT